MQHFEDSENIQIDTEVLSIKDYSTARRPIIPVTCRAYSA